MTSPYKNFEELAQQEVEGKDYQIKFRLRDERALIMAPHGGKIEPTTTMIAEAIAGGNYSCYSFEGLKEEGNGVLHIESHLFDEPQALQAVKKADVVITALWSRRPGCLLPTPCRAPRGYLCFLRSL